MDTCAGLPSLHTEVYNDEKEVLVNNLSLDGSNWDQGVKGKLVSICGKW